MQDRTGVMRSPPNKLGKYEIRKLLGKGNMGMVYLAHDPILEREVAVKVMAVSTMHHPELRARFEQEAKAIARLHHPNIVTIHDLGYDHAGSPFIAMELMEGNDLEELIKKKPPSIAQSLEIVAQVCRGLHRAHSAGIVHRDVKPPNIFVTKDGAKIMDFGVARWALSSQTQTGMVLGTARYMSPEQIRGERVDGRSDIFSVGIVLYELLTNEKLFAGENIETVFFKTLSHDPPELVTSDGRDYPEIQRIVSASLARDFEDRFATAEKMAEAIEAVLRTEGAALPEAPVFRRASRTEAGSGSLRELHDATLGRRVVGTAGASETTKNRAETTRPGGANVTPTEVMRPTPRPRGRVHTTRRRWPWLAAAALVGSAVAAYFLVVPERVPPPDTPAPPTAAVDLQERFRFAEGLLENGNVAQAFEAVQNILAIEPENERALVLQEEVRKAAQTQTEPDPHATAETHEASPPATPTPREQAAAIAADAALALGNGKLDEAASLISRGRQLEPANPRWSELAARLRAEKTTAELEASAVQQLEAGRRALEGGDFQRAIDAYKAAMEYAPESREAQRGLESAIRLKHEADNAQRAAAAAARQFVESDTEFVPAPSAEEQTQEVVGFEMEDRFEVNETPDPFFPAKIIIEVHPADAKPGEPYVLRVRVFNEGYRPVEVRGLELVSRFGGKTVGKGVEIPTRTQRIEPQATVLVHEIAGTWKEAQQHGELTATVMLVEGGKFTKSISW